VSHALEDIDFPTLISKYGVPQVLVFILNQSVKKGLLSFLIKTFQEQLLPSI
jgi:hypothetical protein